MTAFNKTVSVIPNLITPHPEDLDRLFKILF